MAGKLGTGKALRRRRGGRACETASVRPRVLDPSSLILVPHGSPSGKQEIAVAPAPAAAPAERAEASFRRVSWGGPPAVLPCPGQGPSPMTPIPILRHVPHEPAGTLADALAAAGLEFRYVDLFDATPTAAQLDLDRARAGRDGRADERRPDRALSVSGGRGRFYPPGPRSAAADAGDLPGRPVAGQIGGGQGLPQPGQGNRLVFGRPGAGGRRGPALCRLWAVAGRLPMARRHVRLAAWGRAPGRQPVVPPAGLSPGLAPTACNSTWK